MSRMLSVSTLSSASKSLIRLNRKGEGTIVRLSMAERDSVVCSLGDPLEDPITLNRSLEGRGGLMERTRLAGKSERWITFSPERGGVC